MVLGPIEILQGLFTEHNYLPRGELSTLSQNVANVAVEAQLISQVFDP